MMISRQQWTTVLWPLLGVIAGIVVTVAVYRSYASANAGTTTIRVDGEPIPWIGTNIQNVDSTTAEALNLRQATGVLVSRVFDGSPAGEAGIQPGDVIVRFDRQRITDPASMKNVLADLSVGDTVKVNIIRDGSRRSVYITIAARPAAVTLVAGSDATAVTPTASWGMVVSPLSSEAFSALNLPDGKGGVIIVEVYPGGLAVGAGLLPGDVIVGVNGHKVEDLKSFYEKMAKADAIVLDIYRNGLERFVSVDAGGAVLPLARIAGTTDTSDGYQGKPPVIPPMGSAAAGVLPQSSSNRSLVCICLSCGTRVLHPAGVSCADLTCPVCGQRMTSANAGARTAGPATIPPMGQRTGGQPATIPPMGQTSVGGPIAGAVQAAVTQLTGQCICPSCGTTVDHPLGVPCSSLSCPVCGSRLVNSNPGQNTLSQPTAGELDTSAPGNRPNVERPDSRPPPIGRPTSGQPDTIPPMGSNIQATAVTYVPIALSTDSGNTVISYVPIGGQPSTIPPMGQSTGGQPSTIPPMGQSTGGQPSTIPPMGQSTGGQPSTIPPMGQSTGGQPDTIPPMGQTSAGGPATGTVRPTAALLASECLCPLCGTTVYHPLGVPCSSLSCPVCGSRLVNATPGQNTLSQPGATTLPGTTGQGAANQARSLSILPMPSSINNTIVYPRSNLGQGFGAAPSLSDVTQMQQGTQIFSIAGGLGQGGGGSNLAGPTGYCICPSCGTTAAHEAGIPCTALQCPTCGSMMVRALNTTTVAGGPVAASTVAIAVAGSSLDSGVAAFDTAPNYVFVDLSTGTAQIIPNPNVGDVTNVGSQSAQFVVDRGADTVIADSFSGGALNALTQLRTETLRSVFGSVQDAINSYFNMLRGSSSESSPVAVNPETSHEEEGRQYGLTKERASSKKSKGESSL